MEQAVQYTEQMETFLTMIKNASRATTVTVADGRRFDRVIVDGSTMYFVDRHTWEIYGAKSSFQFNPRRWYGRLQQINEFNWVALTPVAGSTLETEWNTREEGIKQGYKPRGRPRKVAVTP